VGAGAKVVTLAALLTEHPFADDEPLLHGVDGTRTAGDTRTAAREFADRLHALGVRVGDAVAVQRPNDTSFIVAMFGVWLAGGVFVPVNARAPEAERAAALHATRARILVSGDEILVEGDDLFATDDQRVYDANVAFVLWTSGTTGQPKPILHTHTAYVELLDRVLGPLRKNPAEVAKRPTPNLIPVSLALNAGIYNVLFGLRAGAPIVVMDRFTPEALAATVARHEIRSTVLPPAAITMCNEAPTVTSLAPLKYVRSITAPLSALQAQRFAEKFGVTVLNGYGQAEIGEVIGWTATDAREHPGKIGAVGRPHPGVDVRIAEPDDRGCGRLLVRPPSMAAGYASGDDLSERIDADGYVDTGDIARIDDEGFVWIEGRGTDVINRGGNKVFPEHVEEVLRLSPAVIDAAVVGAPDERLGEVPLAFVVTNAAVSDDELRELCRLHLVPYKIPVEFRIVDGLPRNEAGKLMRRDLAAQVGQEDT
jgi:acyl-coenzyme A synthetase/AMP-(fatty) acid ligase